MPFVLDYDGHANLLYLTFTGNGSVDEVLGAVRELDGALRRHDGPDILVDSQDLNYTPGPADLRRMADHVARLGPLLRGRLMFVVQPGLQYGLARMFASISEYLGVQVEVFTSVDRALATRDR